MATMETKSIYRLAYFIFNRLYVCTPNIHTFLNNRESRVAINGCGDRFGHVTQSWIILWPLWGFLGFSGFFFDLYVLHCLVKKQIKVENEENP